MIIEFGVAWTPHSNGARYTKIDHKRFPDYDKALEYACTFDDCLPTIYLIVDKKYVFDCRRSKVKNIPYCIYHIERIMSDRGSTGMVETSIWWDDFVKDYKKYLHLAEGELTTEQENSGVK